MNVDVGELGVGGQCNYRYILAALGIEKLLILVKLDNDKLARRVIE